VKPGRLPRRLARLIADHPFTTTVTLLILVLAVVTGPLRGPHRPLRGWVGTGAVQLLDGHWWSPFTSVLFTDNLLELIVALVVTVVLVGASERLMGSWRTALAFFGTAVVGIVLGAIVQTVADDVGELWARNVHGLLVLDVFTAVGGTVMTASAFAGTLWRRRLRVITLLVAVMYVLYSAAWPVAGSAVRTTRSGCSSPRR
jgi:phosphatidylglycerol lysyltransferase